MGVSVSVDALHPAAEEGRLCSVGSTGDSDDNALAATINGLYKAEVIYRWEWRSLLQVELATLN